MSGSLYINPLIVALERASNDKEAQVMKKYMKNNFDFYGVRAPQCKNMLKQHIENLGLPQSLSDLSDAVNFAWQCPKRELQYLGMYIIML